MGKIIYLVGNTVDSRQDLLDSKISSNDYSILHLVPTNGRVMELESDTRFLLKRRGNTFSGVISNIFEENIRYQKYPDYQPLHNSVTHLLLKKALERRNSLPEGLSYFSRILDGNVRDNDFIGIHRGIARFFSDLGDNNFRDIFVNKLTDRMIRAEAESPGTGEARFAMESDLAWLLGDYEEIKTEINGYDEDDVRIAVHEFLREGNIPHIMDKHDVIVLDGFIHFSRIEEDILFFLAKIAKEIWWLIDYDSRSEDPLGDFRTSSGTEYSDTLGNQKDYHRPVTGIHEGYRIFTPLVSLMDRFKEAGIDYHLERADEVKFEIPWSGSLYSPGPYEYIDTKSIKFKSFPDKTTEVRAIAGEIKRIIRDENLDISGDLGKIRIIFPDLKGYSSIINEVFNGYGIPFSLTRGIPLVSHPLADIFCNIFRVPLNNFNLGDIVRLFSSELLHGSEWEECNEALGKYEIPGELLLETDTQAQVKEILEDSYKDVSDFRPDARLISKVGHACGLKTLATALPIKIHENDDELFIVKQFYEEKIHHSKQEKDRIRTEYYSFLFQLHLFSMRMALFIDLMNQDDPKGIEDAFCRILMRFDLPRNIMDIPLISGDPPTESAIKEARKYIKVYSLLVKLIRESSRELTMNQRLFKRQSGPAQLSQFHSIFLTRLKNSSVMDDRNPNVIRISQWLEIRGRTFDYIFAGGLTADDFPIKDTRDFIMPETPGRSFRLIDPVHQSKHLFMHVLKNHRKRLYLSYYRYKEEKEIRPSSVLIDLDEMVRTKASGESSEENEIMGKFFLWDENPYITSRDEMINGLEFKKHTVPQTEKRIGLKTDQIVIKPDTPWDDLSRGFNSTISRKRTDLLSECDGVLIDSDLFGRMIDESGYFFSPSQLEELANCPMRFLFKEFLELKPIEKQGPVLSQKQMGEHLHAILKNFFRILVKDKKNVSDLDIKKAFSLAQNVFKEYMQRHPFLDSIEFFSHQAMEFSDGLASMAHGPEDKRDIRLGTFAMLLLFEGHEWGNRLPRSVEFFFGERSESLTRLGDAVIRGYIDRFDMDRTDNKTVHIYDYKSGRIPEKSLIKKGLSFQLPAYIRALKNDLGLKKVRAHYYSLKREDFINGAPVREMLRDRSDGTGLDISGINLIDRYVDDLMLLLKKGVFHHSVDEIKCDFCDFKYACRKDTKRLKYLSDSDDRHFIYSGKKNMERWSLMEKRKKEIKSAFQSMKKALTLKTQAARARHYETVMDFKREFRKTCDDSPFSVEYQEEILKKIDEFEKEYNNK